MTQIKKNLPQSKNYSVKQVFHTSMEMNGRLIKYCKHKGIKSSQVCMYALNDFLTNNNY